MLKQRGDTIVEVALAFAVFALLAMGSIVLMNQGTATAQRALEQTQVRQVINGQADALRAARQDAGLWTSIKTNATTNVPTFASLASGCPTAGNITGGNFAHSFMIAVQTVGSGPAAVTSLFYQPLISSTYFASAPVTSYIDYTAPKAYGIWVQAVKISGSAGSSDAYDMHIYACWDTVGTKVPATLATIVRLYDTN